MPEFGITSPAELQSCGWISYSLVSTGSNTAKITYPSANECNTGGTGGKPQCSTLCVSKTVCLGV